MRRGRLVTIEGIDGAGKTTLAASLSSALSARGVDAYLMREPGGVLVAERIRELVKNRDLEVSSRAEALLYAAARAQLVEEAIMPHLAKGSWVLLDRFVDSSLAYQGAGRGLGIEAIREINEFATGGLRPDRTLLLALAPSEGRTRPEARSEPLDRLELERDEFHAAIASAYQQLATEDRDRIRVIDATLDPEAVLEAALRELADLL